MAKEIELTKGYKAIVSDEDYEGLSKYKWHAATSSKSTVYAKRGTRKDDPQGSGKIILMHRQILGLTDPKVFVDHKNHNGLDNRRDNLREADVSKNGANRRSTKGSLSKYLGVNLKRQKTDGKEYTYWIARLQKEGKRYSGGFHSTEEAAARAYNELALKHFGPFANLNQI